MQASGPIPKTGGERPHKIGLEFDPFRTTRAKSPHIRLPPVAQVSFFRMPEARMSLFRVAALLIMFGIALSAVGKSATPQNSATKQAAQPDDIPKSIAESVSGTLQFAEGNFLGLAEAMPEDKYSFMPVVGKFDGVRSFGEQVKHVACAQ